MEKEKKKREPSDHHLLWQLLLIAILWILWTAGISYLLFPRLQKAWRESGVAELMEKNYRRERTEVLDRTVSVSLLRQNDDRLYTIVTKRRGGDVYHDTMEALLHDYIPSAYREGAISIIDPRTKLIGITVRDGICYVDLSSEFLQSPTYGERSAADLIEKTLLNFEKIEKVVILVEGAEYRKGAGNPAP